MTRAFVILAVALLSAGIVSTADAEQTAALNPCKLVTAADAKAVLGTAVLPPVLNLARSSELSNCTYESQSHRFYVTVYTRTISKAGFLKSEKVIRDTPGTVSETITGLGAPAFIVGPSVLFVWHHGHEARFEVGGVGIGQSLRTREIKLAKRVLPRI